MTDPRRKLAEGALEAIKNVLPLAEVGLSAVRPAWPRTVQALARELLSALDALDAARKEPDERLVACDRAFREAWDRAEAAENKCNELQAALDAADGRTETIRIYEDLFSELGIDTAQPQEAIFEELRRKISALVVAADPTVVAEGERC